MAHPILNRLEAEIRTRYSNDVGKYIRLIAGLIFVFFLVEVFEPSSSFVRAEPSVVSSAAVFPVAKLRYHRHANSLIRPDQEKKSDQSSEKTGEHTRQQKKTIASHAATVHSVESTLESETSQPCEVAAQPRLDSLPPSFQIRPPSLA